MTISILCLSMQDFDGEEVPMETVAAESRKAGLCQLTEYGTELLESVEAMMEVGNSVPRATPVEIRRDHQVPTVATTNQSNQNDWQTAKLKAMEKELREKRRDLEYMIKENKKQKAEFEATQARVAKEQARKVVEKQKRQVTMFRVYIQ